MRTHGIRGMRIALRPIGISRTSNEPIEKDVPLVPASKAACYIDVTGKTDRRQLAAPGPSVPLQIRHAHIGIVQTSDDEAWKRETVELFFTEVDHARVEAKRDIQ